MATPARPIITREQFDTLIEEVAYDVWENIPGSVVGGMPKDEREALSKHIRKGLRLGLGTELSYLIEPQIPAGAFDVPIEESGLPTRLKNVLLAMGFTKIDDLKNLSRYRLSLQRSAGNKSIIDLETYLGRRLSCAVPTMAEAKSLGLSWSEYYKQWNQNN